MSRLRPTSTETPMANEADETPNGTDTAGRLDGLVGRTEALYEELANCDQTIRRGMVWCHKCKREQVVNPARCFAKGWPLCCGETMRLDMPDGYASTPNA